MLFELSNLNPNLALTLDYLNPALNNSAQGIKILFFRLRSLSVDVLFWFALILANCGNRVTKPLR